MKIAAPSPSRSSSLLAPGLLYALVFIEGYTVLAVELIAIRQLVSYVGNGTDVISIIIAAVLLPLAFGYYTGGHNIIRRRPGTVRRRLSRNFRTALLFLTPALSLLIIDAFFMILSAGGILHRLTLTSLYALIFLTVPIFCLGQTIPLISRYFRSVKTEKVAARMLAWSTLGSFLGSVFSTIVVMAWFGVHVAVLLVLILIVLAIALTSRTLSLRSMAVPLLVLGAGFILNAGGTFRAVGISYQNAYNTVRIVAGDGERVLLLNNGPSSIYNVKTGETYGYIRKAESLFIDPIRDKNPKRDILVLGAGGFTFGLNDTFHSYTYVDIDPDLKKLTEDEFLQRKLTPNKTFFPVSARGFLREAKARGTAYDLVYIDTYNGERFIPESLVTEEFFAQVRGVAKPGGVVLANIVASPMFTDPYSINLDATFRAVFPSITRMPISDFDGWPEGRDTIMNLLYIAPVPAKGTPTSISIYTDDRNPVYLDKESP